MKTLIIGATGSGKSSYIEKILLHTDSDKQVPVLMGYQIKSLIANGGSLPENCIIHYSLRRIIRREGSEMIVDPFMDPVFKFLIRNAVDLDIKVLVAKPRLLKYRLLTRKKVEPHAGPEANFPAILQLFEEICLINLVELYEKAVNLFELHGASPKFLNGNWNMEFDVVTQEDAFKILLDPSPVNYSYNDMENIFPLIPSNYQKFNQNNQQSGIFERHQTFELLSKHLVGANSLLDIGCAEGYFCFEAEKKGVKNVLGTEIILQRYLRANLNKELFRSNAQFELVDFFKKPSDAQFDIVLLLNVLHHLPFPFEALKIISRICSRVLILEFPTLMDPKFSSNLPSNMFLSALDEYALIGLSSNQTQNFLFSPEAIKLFITRYLTGFSVIQMLKSPFQNSRYLAVCYKNG